MEPVAQITKKKVLDFRLSRIKKEISSEKNDNCASAGSPSRTGGVNNEYLHSKNGKKKLFSSSAMKFTGY